MSTTVKHFDILDCVNAYKAMGVREDVAQYTARQIDEAINLAVDTAKNDVTAKDLATKSDIELLKGDLKLLEIRLLKCMFGMTITLFLGLGGLMLTLFEHFAK